MLHDEAKRLGSNWIAMGWIVVESRGSHPHVFRIRRLQNEHAARQQHTQSFVEKIDERLEWQMLDDVKCRDGAAASIAKRSQVGDKVCDPRIESEQNGR